MENIWRRYVESLIRTMPNDGMVTSHHPADLDARWMLRTCLQSFRNVAEAKFANRLLKNRGDKKKTDDHLSKIVV